MQLPITQNGNGRWQVSISNTVAPQLIAIEGTGSRVQDTLNHPLEETLPRNPKQHQVEIYSRGSQTC